MEANLSHNLSALEDPMPRLSPRAAAQHEHVHPVIAKTFTRPLEGPPSADSLIDFIAAGFAAGMPGNAAIGPEGSRMVARWVVPMEDYPRNRR
jgi:hypothetical protein